MSSLETLEGIWRTRPGGLAFAQYAESLDGAGRRDEAVQILSEGVARWPRNLSGRILQGRIARDQGNLELARLAFQAAVEIDNNSRAALHGLADVCTRQQYLKLAFETWNRLSILDPEDVEAAESARRVATRMDSKGDMDSVVQVREQEDFFSREALSEGAFTPAPAAASQTQTATLPDFDLNFGTTPVVGDRADALDFGKSDPFGLEGFQTPELSFAAPVAPVSSTPLAKFEESAFATLEMPSFPSKTIPPPPLDPPPAPNLSKEQNPFSILEEPVQSSEATQWVPAVAGNLAVTGDDIEDRLDEVFGASVLPVAPSAPPPTTTPDLEVSSSGLVSEGGGQKVTGDDVENRLDELFGETSEFSLHPTAKTIALPKPNSLEVTGDDIEGRMDHLFDPESVIDLTSPTEDGLASEDDSDPFSVTRTVAFVRTQELEAAGDTSALERAGDTTIESRLPVGNLPGAESTTEFNARTLNLDRMVEQAAIGSEMDATGSTIDLSTTDATGLQDTQMSARLSAEDVDSRLDELFATSEFQIPPPGGPAAGKTGFVARPPSSSEGVVTGDDIEGRLDDLFGSDSDFPVSLPTVTFAEEYLRQGHKEKAISIYRQLLDRDPTNNDLRNRLDQIEGRS